MDDTRQPFLSHLQELSRRLKWSLVAVAIAMVVCFFFAETLLDLLSRPLLTAFRDVPRMHFRKPTDVFFVYVKIALIAGIIVSAPFVFLQLWLFIAPGLYRRERRMVIPFVALATFFFFGGVLFAYFIVLPFGFDYLLGFAYDRSGNFSILEQMAKVFDLVVDYKKAGFMKAELVPTIMIDDYVGLVMKLMLGFGLIFELPLGIYFIARIGLVTHRGLLRFFRYWLVISFLIAAVLTPPDVITQVMMAGPLIVMYLASTVVAWIIVRRRERREAQQGHEPDDAA